MKRILIMFAVITVQFTSWCQTQTIKGFVYDEASKSPLIGVVVQLTNSVPQKGAITDEQGRFAIDSVPLGRHSLKISYISFEDRLVSEIDVTAGKEVNLNIGMQESVKTLKEVIITYNRGKDKNKTINDMSLVSGRSFNVDETNRYAGSLGDPSRMAANYAGIVAGNDSRNDIVVRGNSPTGMLWQIEGLNSPNPNHFGTLNATGGPVSMLNSNNIDKSDFFTGAFPAQYGNAIAGAFDINLREGNRDKPEYVAQIGFNGFEGGAEGPIGKNVSYLINCRYSTLQVFKDLGINVGTGTAVPVYEDVNFKVVAHVTKKSKLSFFGVMGYSYADFLGKDIDTSMPDLYGGNPYLNQRTKFATTVNGLSYDYQLSDKSSAKFLAGYCTTYQHFTSDSISNKDGSIYPDQYALFKTAKITLQGSYLHKYNAKNNIQAGITYENTGFNTSYSKMHAGAPTMVYEDQTGNIGMEQAYIQWKHRFNYAFSFVGGIHTQFLNINNTSAVEPRAAFRYALNSKNSVSIGYGLHSQAQNVYTYFIQTPSSAGIEYLNKNLGFTQSQHFIAEYDFNVTEKMRIKIEGYYQMLSKVPVSPTEPTYSTLNSGSSYTLDNETNLMNKGTGTNYGAEATIEHFLDKGFYFLVTGSLINSKYKGNDGIERNTAFNTGYVANALAGKEIRVGKNNVLTVNMKVCLIGGKYLTPIDLAASKLAGAEVFNDNGAFSIKQSDYFRSDLRISYRKEYRKSTMEFSIDFENITNHKNIFDQTYDVRTGRIVSNYQQGFFPVPLFRYTF